MKYDKIILIHRCCQNGLKQFNNYIGSELMIGNTFEHKIIYNIFNANELKLFEKYNLNKDEIINYSWIVIPEIDKIIKIKNEI